MKVSTKSLLFTVKKDIDLFNDVTEIAKKMILQIQFKTIDEWYNRRINCKSKRNIN